MEPSREEIRSFLAGVNAALEEFTGTTEYHLALSKGQKYYELFRVANELLKFDGVENVDTTELKRKFGEFFGIIRSIDVRFQQPYSKHPVDYVVGVVQTRLDPPRKSSSLADTKFLYYRNAALELARKVVEAKKAAEVRTLYKEVPKDELKHFMNHARYLVKKLDLLEEYPVRVTDSVVERYWRLYFDICGHLERIIYSS